MSFEIRYAHPDELPAVIDLDGASFGAQYDDDDLPDIELDIELDTMLVAMDGGRLLGVSCEVPFTMTLPGGATAATGITWVSVEPTSRRRGVLRALMEQQVRTLAGQGVPALVLTASEATIYARFGFGVATRVRKLRLDRRAARPVQSIVEHGVVRMNSADARDALVALYDRWRQVTPGALDRNDKRWQLQLLERPWSQRGRSALFHLVHEDGYVSYRMSRSYDDLGHRNVCSIVDYVVCTPQAHAGLWQVLLDLDLVMSIESNRVPLDDPLPHLLTDPRQVTTTALTDGLWVRPLDVAGLLAARSYAVDLDVVLRVRDPLLGDGTFRLTGGPTGATCAPTNDAADLDLDIAALGAIALGGTRVAQLARAGQVLGSAALVARLDRAFVGDVEPQFGTYF